MTLPKKEKTSQLDDVKKMLLPEMVPNLLKSLGINSPSDENNALHRLDSVEYKGLELLKILEGRIPKCIKHGSPESVLVNKVSYPTEISTVQDNLDIIGKQLSLMKQHIETSNDNFNWKLFYGVIETAIFIGYYSGAHDMKAPIERHANSGFISSVLKPQAGGEKTASKYIPTHNLITAMADFVMNSKVDGKISRTTLVSGIFIVMKEFASIETNRTLLALQPFHSRYPSEKFISEHLKGYDFSLATGMKRLSKGRIVELIKSKFSATAIKKLITA